MYIYIDIHTECLLRTEISTKFKGYRTVPRQLLFYWAPKNRSADSLQPQCVAERTERNRSKPYLSRVARVAALLTTEMATTVLGTISEGCACALSRSGGTSEKHWELCSGNSIAAVAQKPKIAGATRAFALCVGADRIVAWGCGGDSTAVKDKLRSVQEIHPTHSAFAAILGDGSVVTWGNPNSGGDSSAVQDQLRALKEIHCSIAQW